MQVSCAASASCDECGRALEPCRSSPDGWLSIRKLLDSKLYLSQRRASLSIACSAQELKALCAAAKVQETALKAFMKAAGKKG